MRRRNFSSKQIQFSQNEEFFEEDVNKQQDYFPFTFFKGTAEEVTHFLPNDVLDYILLFIPAYPYYYTLRRVSDQWKEELEQRVYFRVEHLDLIPRFEMEKSIVKYKPFLRSGYSNSEVDTMEALKCLVKCFPNTKQIVSFSEGGNVSTALQMSMFEQFAKLESLTLVEPYGCYKDFNFSKLIHLKNLELMNFHYTTKIVLPSTLFELTLTGCTVSFCHHMTATVNAQHCGAKITQVHTFSQQDLQSEDDIIKQITYLHDQRKLPLLSTVIGGRSLEYVVTGFGTPALIDFVISKGYKFTRAAFLSACKNAKTM